MTTPVQVRQATEADADTLKGVLARAFSNDPVMSWIFRNDATRIDDLSLLFSTALAMFVPKGLSWVATDLGGAALWAPRGDWQMGDEVVAEMAPVMTEAYGADTVGRLLTVFGLMDELHPTADNYYLACLASDQGRQGQGIGTATMRPVLARADAEGVPCYLESSNERNVPLYERNGFETTKVVQVADDGPPMWLMWRNPR
jgi:GNAT superfamily N-acetyltransferase